MENKSKENILIAIAQEAYQAQQMKKHYESLEKDLLNKLKNECGDRSFARGGYVFQKSVRQGVIDYSVIIKDFRIDVAPYRKEDVVSWKLSYIEDMA